MVTSLLLFAGTGLDKDGCSQRFSRDSRRGVERLSLLQNSSFQPRLHEGNEEDFASLCYEEWKKWKYNNLFGQDNFYIIVETYHLPDRGDQANVHELEDKKLKKRSVVHIDIANDPVASADYKPDQDPKTFKSEKTGRGPLTGEWRVSEFYIFIHVTSNST